VLRVQVTVANDPLSAVVEGAGKCLEKMDKFEEVLM
jgi:actin-like ATPase involved in cell morphogenesis